MADLTPGQTEAERAAFYQAHKDDPAVWGSPVRASSKPRRRLSAMCSVRLTPTELATVQKRAAARGLSVSSFLRAAALADLSASETLGQVRSEWSSWRTERPGFRLLPDDYERGRSHRIDDAYRALGRIFGALF